MDKETSMFVLPPFLLIGGLVVVIYGVSLNSGQAINMTMVAGGVVMLVAVGILAFGLMTLEDEEEGEIEEAV